MTSIVMMTDASATSSIMAANGAPACGTCHTGGAFSKAEGQAGLAAFLATKVPVCVAPKVLNATKTACITPTPVCVAPKVLQGNVCVAPTPTCTAPKVLQGNICVTPTPTCTAPQVLQGNVCVTPTTTCTAPQVLQGTVCVTPITTCTAPKVLQGNVCVTPIPTCTAPQVLQGNVCVTPATPPTACKDDDDEDEHDDDSDGHNEHDSDKNDKKSKESHSKVVPTLSAPDKVSVHAGESLKLAVTAFDCGDRSIKIQATHLPKGSKIENSIDPELHMPKAVISWTPPANAAGQNAEIVLKAVASDDNSKKTNSAPQTVLIEVLPAAQPSVSTTDTLVKNNTVANARLNAKSQKLEVSGQVTWVKGSAKEDRLAIISAKTVEITDAITAAPLGTAQVDKKGNWKTTIAASEASAPCSVDTSFDGKSGVKAVKGVKHCKK